MKSTTWQVRVSPDLDKKASDLAESMGLGQAELIRFIVAQYVDNQMRAQNYMKDSLSKLVSETGKLAIDQMMDSDGAEGN